MHHHRLSFFLLSASCLLLLTACGSAQPAANSSPINLDQASHFQAQDQLVARVNQLEQDVGGLKKDMTEAKPTLQKMRVLEHGFRQLSLELDRIEQNYTPTSSVPVPVSSADPSAVPSPAVSSSPSSVAKVDAPSLKTEALKESAPKSERKPVAKPAAKPAAKPVATAQDRTRLQAVRIGDQKNHTRLVLDLGQSAPITYDLDNQEKILVMDVKNLSPKEGLRSGRSGSDLISSWAVQNLNGASRVVVQLKKPVRVKSAARLTPDSSGGHRYYIDLVQQ
jgi:hypothetical protein